MIHFSNVCSGKPNNWSKSLHPKKPSKGKHRARSTDVEEFSSGQMLTLAIADSDNREEYTFNTGAEGHQSTYPIFHLKIMKTPSHIMVDSQAATNMFSKRDFDGLK